MGNIESRIREFLKNQRVIEVLRNLRSHLGSLDTGEQASETIENNIKMLRAKGLSEITFADLKRTNPKFYETYLSEIIRGVNEYSFKVG